jgi:hypothetical protein
MSSPENIKTVFASLQLKSFDLSSLGGQAAKEANVLSIEAVVDSHELRFEHVVQVITIYSPIRTKNVLFYCTSISTMQSILFLLLLTKL